MASSAKTSNFNLNQWSANDPVLREDFNADNQALDAHTHDGRYYTQDQLDALLADRPKMAAGRYTGPFFPTSSNMCTISVPFTPKLAIITDMSGGYIMVAPETNVLTGNSLEYTAVWGTNSVSWYGTVTSSSTSTSTYTYFILG